jgi:hypothetical protein
MQLPQYFCITLTRTRSLSLAELSFAAKFSAMQNFAMSSVKKPAGITESVYTLPIRPSCCSSLLDIKSSWICIEDIFASVSLDEGGRLRERLREPRRALARFLLTFFGDLLGERERLRE